jgi:small nuclear ribonucleoprotein (snRNP)-like protein
MEVMIMLNLDKMGKYIIVVLKSGAVVEGTLMYMDTDGFTLDGELCDITIEYNNVNDIEIL